MNADIEHTRDKEREWPVWVGSMEDLDRLARMVEQLADVRRQSILVTFDKETDQELDTAKTASPELEESDSTGLEHVSKTELDEIIRKNVIESIRLRRTTERSYLEKSLQVTATLVDGDDTTKGEAASVLAELDKRTVKSVEFEMWHRGERITLLLDKKESRISDYGAKLRVASKDRGWANQAFVQLSEEVAKGVPNYSWIRRRRGRLVVVCGSAVAPAVALALMIAPSVPSKDRPLVWFGAYLLGMTLALITGVPDWLFDWLAPRFEVVSNDSQSTGRRRIAAFVAPIVAVVLGIVVNRIYA